ncbi:hypothetical protein [Miltoncostaea oceani]|uniref:hypothetical protein n=1 Tax=Miltoncostaea oceani TaxID=2843216 RepID=UPI001C3C296A|nr:hypothetical protein [Miltoncostaea oceani]
MPAHYVIHTPSDAILGSVLGDPARAVASALRVALANPPGLIRPLRVSRITSSGHRQEIAFLLVEGATGALTEMFEVYDPRDPDRVLASYSQLELAAGFAAARAYDLAVGLPVAVRPHGGPVIIGLQPDYALIIERDLELVA